MPAHIMVIDDDKSMRKLFTSILTQAGWQVFNDGYASIDLGAVEFFRPDLIILNFDMRQDGVDWGFLQLLKMEDSTATIPVLVCTTANSLSPRIAGYLSGRNIRVVHKPLATASFVLLVQEILNAATPLEGLSSNTSVLPILVVEDNMDLREMVTQILTLEGYLVVTAANGQLALETVAVMQSRLIILDINMPIMDGVEFLAIYAQQPGPHTPVIVCRAIADRINLAVLPPFVIATLVKPYRLRHLLTLVQEYMRSA